MIENLRDRVYLTDLRRCPCAGDQLMARQLSRYGWGIFPGGLLIYDMLM